ncbi:MAG: hypothetical protein ACE1Z4_12540 [Gammaproteobacteria bacterium]
MAKASEDCRHDQDAPTVVSGFEQTCDFIRLQGVAFHWLLVVVDVFSELFNEGCRIVG